MRKIYILIYVVCFCICCATEPEEGKSGGYFAVTYGIEGVEISDYIFDNGTVCITGIKNECLWVGVYDTETTDQLTEWHDDENYLLTHTYEHIYPAYQNISDWRLIDYTFSEGYLGIVVVSSNDSYVISELYFVDSGDLVFRKHMPVLRTEDDIPVFGSVIHWYEDSFIVGVHQRAKHTQWIYRADGTNVYPVEVGFYLQGDAHIALNYNEAIFFNKSMSRVNCMTGEKIWTVSEIDFSIAQYIGVLEKVGNLWTLQFGYVEDSAITYLYLLINVDTGEYEIT